MQTLLTLLERVLMDTAILENNLTLPRKVEQMNTLRLSNNSHPRNMS